MGAVHGRRERSGPVEGDRPHRVVTLAMPGVIAFDLAIVAQVFGVPEEAGRYSFAVAAAEPGIVATSTSFGIEVRDGLEKLADADTIVVPGFRPFEHPDPLALEALREAAARGTRIASVCIGAFALAAAGLLDGLEVTTHWREADQFRQLFPAVRLNPDVLYVDAGQILTSAGLSAGIDLCLYLVRRDFGAAAASAVAARMVVAAHRPGGQSQYAAGVAEDDGLSATFDWTVGQLHRLVSVAEMARHAGLPVRSFTRRFRERTNMTPMGWLASQRLLEARRLLEATRLEVDEVASRSGHGTAANLRAHMRRELSTTPTRYRREARRSEDLLAEE